MCGHWLSVAYTVPWWRKRATLRPSIRTALGRPSSTSSAWATGTKVLACSDMVFSLVLEDIYGCVALGKAQSRTRGRATVFVGAHICGKAG